MNIAASHGVAWWLPVLALLPLLLAPLIGFGGPRWGRRAGWLLAASGALLLIPALWVVGQPGGLVGLAGLGGPGGLGGFGGFGGLGGEASGARLTFELPWLLLHVRLQVDAASALLLLLTALLWVAAVAQAVVTTAADRHCGRFGAALAVTLAAFTTVVLAADLATFYFAYATMTLAAYPLIIHQQTPQAQRAGRVYLAMAVLAEGVLLSAVLMIAGAAGNPQLSAVPEIIAAHPFSDWLVLLLGVGFAVKAGAVPLHVWLPLAHPAAPIPASALLSGLLVKAALVGWLRLLPLGEAVWPTFAAAALAVAVVTVLYANLVGLTQRRAKTVLAYSTVSQMGLLIAMVGLAALVPAAAPVAFAAALLFAVHHGLAKGALFLSCAFAGRRSAWRYALLPALALAGAPLSSGAVAKAGLKEVGEAAALEALVLSLSFASLLTTLLMARLLWLLYRQGVESPQEGEQRGGEWLTRATVLFTVAASLTVPWLLAGRCCPTLLSAALQPSALWAAAWPLLLGSALVVAALFGGYALWRRSLKSRSGNRGDDHTRDRIRDYIDSHSRDSRGQPWTVPEGDWIKPALLGGVRLARRLRRLWRRAPPRPPLPAWGVVGARWSAAIESRLVALAMAGALFLVLVLGISVLGMWAGR